MEGRGENYKDVTDQTMTKTEYSLPMKGGDGDYSYSKNSSFQRIGADSFKDKIKEEIIKKFDVKSLISDSKTVQLADLGCSTGPNTFINMQNILEGIKLKHNSQCPNSEPPEFHVFFNDRTTNDFNTLFASIPPSAQYFSAGVPGSFHDRLFPESSLHFVLSAYSLHWLSSLPEELLEKDSLVSNNGRIDYVGAPREVCDAYESRFCEDIGRFFSARAKEIVPGGMMVIIMAGRANGNLSDSKSFGSDIMYTLLQSTLYELANEGLIREDTVDSFNLPVYCGSPEEIIGLVEKNGSFSIERIELILPTTLPANDAILFDVEMRLKHLRAAWEEILRRHFGNEIIDQLFERLREKARHNSEKILSKCVERFQLFVVLKRT